MLLPKAIELFHRQMINTDRAPSTIKGYVIELKLLNRFLTGKYNGPVYLKEITLEDLESYLEMLKQKGTAPASRSRSIYIIRAFYNFCCKKSLAEKNISLNLEAVAVPEKERAFLTSEEMKTLISEVTSPLARLILNTLFCTGMRISECLNLSIKDVDLKRGIITVRHTKNKRDRQIPINKELLPLLKDYFHNWRRYDTNRYFFAYGENCKVSADYMNRVLHEATTTLGWDKKVTCHIIRHSFASNLVLQNINIVSIQKLLGHSNLSTTSIYTHTNMEELLNAVNKIV